MRDSKFDSLDSIKYGLYLVTGERFVINLWAEEEHVPYGTTVVYSTVASLKIIMLRDSIEYLVTST